MPLVGFRLFVKCRTAGQLQTRRRRGPARANHTCADGLTYHGWLNRLCKGHGNAIGLRRCGRKC